MHQPRPPPVIGPLPAGPVPSNPGMVLTSLLVLLIDLYSSQSSTSQVAGTKQRKHAPSCAPAPSPAYCPPSTAAQGGSWPHPTSGLTQEGPATWSLPTYGGAIRQYVPAGRPCSGHIPAHGRTLHPPIASHRPARFGELQNAIPLAAPGHWAVTHRTCSIESRHVIHLLAPPSAPVDFQALGASSSVAVCPGSGGRWLPPQQRREQPQRPPLSCPRRR